MIKAEWGVKRTCLGCGARFYDLKRSPIICPKCDEELEIAVQQRPKRIKPVAPRKTAAKVVVEKTDDLIDDVDDPDSDSVDDDDTAPDSDGDTDDGDDDGDVVVAKGGDDDALLNDDTNDENVKAVKTGDEDLKDS